MMQLAYCVLRAGADLPDGVPAGIEGAAVAQLVAGALAVAVSPVSDAAVVPDSARATAYARVVAVLSADRTVLPLRYGCTFASAAEAQEFLRVRNMEFTRLLAELDGCVEMGVRALLPYARHGSETTYQPAAPACSGAAYLRGRSAAYARQDGERAASGATAAAVQRAFEGVTVKSRAASTVVGDAALVSLYFLIRREHAPDFRRRFRQLQRHADCRLLLSGLWAPYSFVGAATPGERP